MHLSDRAIELPRLVLLGTALLCLTGLMSLFTPSTLPSAAILRLALVGTGFALYGYGRTQKQRDAQAKAGAAPWRATST